VAYADFVTAMMAFFLLLWLLSMSSAEKRAVLSAYFKSFSIFAESGKSFLKESSQIMEHSAGEVKSVENEQGAGVEITAADLKTKLKSAVEEKLKDLKDQVLVDIFEGGVRIQLVDSEGKSIFLPGSAELSPGAKSLLKLVSEYIKDMTSRIAVEGHTDGAPLKKGQMTNWELSTARASSARKELEADNISSNRIARVVGYADTELLVPDKPTDPKNRRISIILLPPKIKETAKPSIAQPLRQEVPRSEPVLSEGAQKAPTPSSGSGPGPVKSNELPKPVPEISAENGVSRSEVKRDAPVPKKDKVKTSISPEVNIRPSKPIDIFQK